MEAAMCETYADEAAVRQRLEAAGLATVLVAAGTDGDMLADGHLERWATSLRDRGVAAEVVAGVLAQALTGQAAVWWACRVARCEPGGGIAEAELPAVEAAEAWLRSPEQWRAYAANSSAESVGLGTPAGCAALAAFLAGDSIAPSHLDALAPQPHLVGMAAAAAVELAATRRPLDEGTDAWGPLLAIGFAIATGDDSWQESPVG
jgi:hypothetical protein